MTNTQEEKIVQINGNRLHVWYIAIGIVCSMLTLFSLLLFFSALWYIKYYGNTGFDSVLYTLFSNLGGVSKGLLSGFCLESVLPTVLIGAVLIFLVYGLNIKKAWVKKIKFWHKTLFLLLLVILFFILAGTKVNVFGYIQKIALQTTLYEDYFVEPSSENIQFPEKKRNLIYIFLESMETTYMSEAEGGACSLNVIPELTKLAVENTNFSHNESVGGFSTPSGTGWTVAGMVAQTSGVPLKGSAGVLENNEYGKDSFLPGVITLSDILNENGYKQALIVGSDASYANRDVYFKQHKTDEIYDYFSAQEEGIIDKDYYVWWGMEDKYLFDYAKEKIRALAKGSEPFACTILTADTHFPEGFVCSRCDDTFSEQYNNVLSCASRQVADFIKWLTRQSFYDNTTIVICGDHLSMDNQYIERNIQNDYERKGYNCFINPIAEGTNYKNRTFTSLDIFPTTLAAIGCDIRGERLGLGTNLFSERQTLAEEMGYEEFDHKLLYSSNYYIKKFMVANSQ
ncbi:MAG: LTA synthase family protein [Clostridia bacterium]|nr:LTA synthase family protein [Clostridia bacterium]